jgi:hypothetical protein
VRAQRLGRLGGDDAAAGPLEQRRAEAALEQPHLLDNEGWASPSSAAAAVNERCS